jgi:hypothetical protein
LRAASDEQWRIRIHGDVSAAAHRWPRLWRRACDQPPHGEHAAVCDWRAVERFVKHAFTATSRSRGVRAASTAALASSQA